MRVMTIMKATADSEAGVSPSAELLNAMGKFNAEMVAAGILVAGDGLKPSSTGVRVHFDASGATRLVDGPFAETKELVSGFWILEVASLEEAVAWIRRAPSTGDGTQVEIRPIYGPEDFENATPEMVAAEEELRARSAEQHGA